VLLPARLARKSSPPRIAPPTSLREDELDSCLRESRPHDRSLNLRLRELTGTPRKEQATRESLSTKTHDIEDIKAKEAQIALGRAWRQARVASHRERWQKYRQGYDADSGRAIQDKSNTQGDKIAIIGRMMTIACDIVIVSASIH
jgi:hypothetical protein